jgi:hypothetical protein
MTKLTLNHIRRAISLDPRLEKDIDLDEPGKAILYTKEGWTWEARDGNRTVEGFLIAEDNCDGDPQDTLVWFRERLRMIERAT